MCACTLRLFLCYMCMIRAYYTSRQRETDGHRYRLDVEIQIQIHIFTDAETERREHAVRFSRPTFDVKTVCSNKKCHAYQRVGAQEREHFDLGKTKFYVCIEGPLQMIGGVLRSLQMDRKGSVLTNGPALRNPPQSRNQLNGATNPITNRNI